MLQETIRMYEAEGAFLSPEYQAMLKDYALPPHRCVIIYAYMHIYAYYALPPHRCIITSMILTIFT